MRIAEQRRALEAAITKHPDWCDNWHAQVFGCHSRTVRDARRRLIDRGEIPELVTRMRRNGSRYPVPQSPESCTTSRQDG
jgi:hypothetical protein